MWTPVKGDKHGVVNLLASEALEWMGVDEARGIIRTFPIPPTTIRPSSMAHGNEVRGEDSITKQLLKIIRVNNALAKLKKTNAVERVRNAAKRLQEECGNYLYRSKNNPEGCIAERLRKKEGRMRGTLMGKRCNFTARSVITGDPTLHMSHVGVPHQVADKLTVPERVHRYNIDALRDMLHKCKYAIDPNGKRIDLQWSKAPIRLEPGWIIERPLRDGDIVLFNRQPSLHRPSMMCHRVRRMKGKSFRLNLSCTTPYNADFDGDEMNLHVPQTIEAQVEAAQLMAVQEHVVTAQSHRPVMSIVQDTLIGTYQLTDMDTFLTRDEMMDWCMHIKRFDMPPPSILYPRQLWTGKDAFSMLLPKSTFYGAPKNDPYIAHGILLRGQLNKKQLGRSQRSLVHLLFNDEGPKATVDFISDLQRGIANWFSTQGFSIGISDFTTTHRTKTRINEVYEDTVRDINAREDASEQWINRRLNQARDTMGRAALETITRDNRLWRIVDSGSKGSNVNILQIMACLGQQNVKGQRIPCHVAGRALASFKAGDTNPEARGMVKNSFMDGLTPYDYFFHTVGGREGLVDTAVKTAESGYIQRQLVKCLEALKAHADMSVRDSAGNIVQFVYGDDGRDGTSLEWLSDGVERVATPCPVDRILAREEACNKTPLMDFYAVPTLLNALKDVPKVQSIVGNVLKDHPYAADAAVEGLERWEKARIAAGEMVGVLAAQSLGEPVTQMTLNTFHSAGISAKNVTLGVPRFRELMNASKKQKTPSTTLVYATPAEAKAACKTFKKRTLGDLVARHIHAPTKPERICTFADEKVDDVYDHLIELDPARMREAGIELDDVVDVLEDVQTAWHIFPRERRDLPPAILVSYKGRRVQEPITQFMNTQVQGVGKIITGAVVDECKVYTDGSDLATCSGLEHVLHVDSNDPMDVLKTYGIEAARAVLLRELDAVMSFDGSYVNPRHLKLLVDWMTYGGEITPANRHGVRRRAQDLPIARATFEQPVEVFLDAAANEKKDVLTGISEQLLFGCLPSCGTTMVDAVTDSSYASKMQEMEKEADEELYAEEGIFDASDMFSSAPAPQPSAPAWMMPATRKRKMASPPLAPPAQRAPWEMFQQTQAPPLRAYDYKMAPATTQQAYSPTSPQQAYSPTSPAAYSPTSPAAYSPTSPAAYSPTSPAADSPSSPAAYSPSSPQASYAPTSPQAKYAPTSPQAIYQQ